MITVRILHYDAAGFNRLDITQCGGYMITGNEQSNIVTYCRAPWCMYENHRVLHSEVIPLAHLLTISVVQWVAC